MSELLRPKVGVGVFVFNGTKFLMGLRTGSHGAETWSLPGGHLEFGDTPEGTAIKEVREETSVEIGKVILGAVTNDIFVAEQKHYITLFILSQLVSGEPQVTEPDKFTNVGWYGFDNLPQPLFLPIENLMKTADFKKIQKFSKIIQA